MARLRFAFAATITLGACAKASPPSPSSSSSSSLDPVSSEWREFHGIEFRAPTGTRVTGTDGTLPGPGGLGGVPTGDRPSVVLSKPRPGNFYVEIVKTAEPVSLEGMTYVLGANDAGSNIVGKATGQGWELSYDLHRAGDATPSKSHLFYFHLAGGHYQCKYAEANCADPATAEAICRSVRPKTTK